MKIENNSQKQLESLLFRIKKTKFINLIFSEKFGCLSEKKNYSKKCFTYEKNVRFPLKKIQSRFEIRDE